MTRKILATVLAASIALTSVGAAPAQAGSRDDQIGQLIAGAITLFIFSKVVEANKRNDRARARPAPVPTPSRPKPSRISKILPDECFFNANDRFGQRGVYGKRCLRDVMPNANRLPAHCEDRVRIRNGRRANVYDARCLFRDGYKNAAWQN